MNMLFMREKCWCDFLICSCVPSPQSIMNSSLPTLTICELGLWWVVGSAEPHPNMCTSNCSIVCCALLMVAKVVLFCNVGAWMYCF